LRLRGLRREELPLLAGVLRRLLGRLDRLARLTHRLSRWSSGPGLLRILLVETTTGLAVRRLRLRVSVGILRLPGGNRDDLVLQQQRRDRRSSAESPESEPRS